MIIKYDVEFCYKDLYSETYEIKRKEQLKSDAIPRIGEIIEYNGSWEVFEIIHRYVEKTGYMNIIVRVR